MRRVRGRVGCGGGGGRERVSFGQTPVPVKRTSDGVLNIDAVELIELHGRYTEQAGVDGQPQVNTLDTCDGLRPQRYQDQPSGTAVVLDRSYHLFARRVLLARGRWCRVSRNDVVVGKTFE